MAAKKKGHVLRASDYAWSVIRARQEGTTREALDDLVNELIDLKTRFDLIMKSPTYFILPKAKVVWMSEKEAKGAAIILGVRNGKKGPEEEPVAVKVI